MPRRCTHWAISVFTDWLKESERPTALDHYTARDLNQVLRVFYASVRTSQGTAYSVSSYMSIRAGIHRYFKEFNVMKGVEFHSSNTVFKSLIKKLRRSGQDVTKHHPAIPETDMVTLRQSGALSPATAIGLVRKVWFDIQLHLAMRGREGNRELRRDAFTLKVPFPMCRRSYAFAWEAFAVAEILRTLLRRSVNHSGRELSAGREPDGCFGSCLAALLLAASPD